MTDRVTVYIVKDIENYAGVYFSIKTAVYYIDEWLAETEAKDGNVPFLLTEDDPEYVDGEETWLYRGYVITKSFLRT